MRSASRLTKRATRLLAVAACVVAIGVHASEGDGVVSIPEAARFEILTGNVDFGELPATNSPEISAAVVVRVVANSGWTLRMVEADAGVNNLSRRLRWRVRGSRAFAPLAPVGSAIVTRGPATGAAGTIVMIDLKLDTADTDQPGILDTRLGFVLDTNSPERAISVR